jgi:chromosome partitioning protein
VNESATVILLDVSRVTRAASLPVQPVAREERHLADPAAPAAPGTEEAVPAPAPWGPEFSDSSAARPEIADGPSATDVEHVHPGKDYGDSGIDAIAADPDSAVDVSRETAPPGPPDETPIATQTATAMRVLGHSGETFPRPGRRRIVTVANQKGGVGKTTTTVNIAAAMALHGLRVLVIDLDPQGNASTALGIDHHADIPSVYDLLIEGKSLADVMVDVPEIPGLSCVPATIDLAGAEIELVSMVAREARLRRALADVVGDFDYVLIDCPPSLGLLTVNALVAGEEVLIPIQCEYYALEGLGQLLSNIDLVKSHLNPDLRVSTILLTMYDARTRLASQVADDVRLHFGTTVLRTVIPRSVRVSEAPSYGQTVMTYDPASPGALCYLDAAREIAERGAGSPDTGTATYTDTNSTGPAQGDSP